MVIKFIIDAFIAIGTVAVAVAAIWGDWLRSKLAPAKLTLIGHTFDGEPTLFATGTRAMFYHVKVINQRRWLPTENCRVMLVGLSRRDPGGVFQTVPMAVAWQFMWAPAEFRPPSITLLREQVLDFGYIAEGDKRFTPRLYVTPLNFQGFVGPNDVVRYQIQIEAVSYSSPIYVIEAAWNGQWSYEPATMKAHLPIRLISSPTT